MHNKVQLVLLNKSALSPIVSHKSKPFETVIIFFFLFQKEVNMFINLVYVSMWMIK